MILGVGNIVVEREVHTVQVLTVCDPSDCQGQRRKAEEKTQACCYGT